MSINITQQRLDSYECKTRIDEINAMKEITQEIALMSLSKADFFKKAEFHGGTALRILHGLPRFSEDLDFALLSPDPTFDLNHYLKHMQDDFLAYGYHIEISDRLKTTVTVQKQFLKVDSIGKLLSLQFPIEKSHRKIKIKFEIDTHPPQGATTKIFHLTFPIPFSVLAKDLPSSFSGKLHALLCRSFDKGRDWYDFIWYITHKVSINFDLLTHAINQQGPWQDQNIKVTPQWIREHLTNKIQSIQWKNMQNDVRALLKPHEQHSLEEWDRALFLTLIQKLE